MPTRELAHQVRAVVEELSRHLGARVALLVGGTSMRECIAQLRKGQHIAIGTPGRVLDMMDKGYLKTDKITSVVRYVCRRVLQICS